MRRGLETSGTTLNIPPSKSFGVPEGEVEGQEIENLFAGRSDSPKEVGPKEAHTKAHHTYIT